jgi:hypothetical protein
MSKNSTICVNYTAGMAIDNPSLPLVSTKDTSYLITSQFAPIGQSDNG